MTSSHSLAVCVTRQSRRLVVLHPSQKANWHGQPMILPPTTPRRSGAFHTSSRSSSSSFSSAPPIRKNSQNYFQSQSKRQQSSSFYQQQHEAFLLRTSTLPAVLQHSSVTAWNMVSMTHCDAAFSTAPPTAVATAVPTTTTPAVLSSTTRPMDDDDDESRWRKFRRKVHRAWRMVKRFVKVSVALAPVVFFYPLLSLTTSSTAALQDGNTSKRDAHAIVLMQDASTDLQRVSGYLGWYLRLCLACVEYSGAAVIKLMQWAGSRPDLFGHEFCAVFSTLQDATTPHAWKHTERAMQEAFGKDWNSKIQLHQIVGSGCIGQVYKGTIVDDNNATTNSGRPREVAVKVLHPNVQEEIAADLDLMRLFVRILNNMPGSEHVFSSLKWLNLEGIVEEFADLLQLQLDLRTEAHHLQRFHQNFKGVPGVVFPSLVKGFDPTPHVLVETFCEGTPVLQYARQHKHDAERLHEMCLTAIHAVCKMIFLDNFVHGDLHPGNVFVSKDGKNFIVFDVGIVNEYTDKDHEAIVQILAAFIRKQGRRAGRCMIDESNNRLRASRSGDKALDEEQFLDKIEALTIKASQKGYLMEHLGTYITYICNAAATHHIMMNPSFISAALAVKIQEGIALALDPSIQIWKVATPIIIESERRRGLAKASNQAASALGKLEEFVSKLVNPSVAAKTLTSETKSQPGPNQA